MINLLDIIWDDMVATIKDGYLWIPTTLRINPDEYDYWFRPGVDEITVNMRTLKIQIDSTIDFFEVVREPYRS